MLDDIGYQKRIQAWKNTGMRDRSERKPCDRCGKTHEQYHHATCAGENLCHDCYLAEKPCTQCYPGDWGGSIQSGS